LRGLDQSSRSITFWTEKKKRAQPINEVFMQDLMGRPRMTLYTVIDQTGLGICKTRFESTPPPQGHPMKPPLDKRAKKVR